jgi:biopolymer transport protein ExbB/TolQ
VTKKAKKGWAYIEGHYRCDGTWVPPHWSMGRQLALPICVVVAIWAVALYLLFGHVVLLTMAALSCMSWICIIGKKYAVSKSVRDKRSLKTARKNRLKLYDELCAKLKQYEIFENLIDMEKLTKHENKTPKKSRIRNPS